MADALVRLHAAMTAHRLRWLFVAAVPWLALVAWGATTAAPVMIYVASVVVLVGWLVAVLSGWYLAVLGVGLAVVAVVAWRRGGFAGVSGGGSTAAVGGAGVLALAIGGTLLGNGTPVQEAPDAAPATTTSSTSTLTTLAPRVTTTTTLPSPEVESVTDGDTFRVLIDGGSEAVRIIGIDAPEAGDCLADEATDRLRELLGSGFQLRRDVSDRDGFGRLLRHVDLASGSAGEVLVEEGLAIARRYPPDVAGADRLEMLHEAAQDATAGIWNWFTCGAPALELSNVDEDLVVRNTGTGTLSVGDLPVSDGSTDVYVFPATAALLPSEELTVSPDCGTDTGRRLFACVGSWPLTATISFGDESAFAEFAPVATTTTTATTVPSQAQVAVVELSALRRDAEGNDNENRNDEWVEVANRGPGSADLSGWYIEDEDANHTFRFPTSFILEDGAIVRIRSGCGTETATELFWCNSGSAVWNNDGDTAYLFNDLGELIDRR